MFTLIKNFIKNLRLSVTFPQWKTSSDHEVISTLTQTNTFSGDYPKWEYAVRDSTGYDAQNILDRTLDATLRVKKGEAAFERDSVLLDRPEYPYFLLACLLSAATRKGNELSVLDFGGALGSSYFQCRKFLVGLKDLRWSVVEQKKHVDCGRQYIEDDILRFYYTIDDCLKNEKPDVIVLSGVLSVIERPYDLIKKIISHQFQNVIVDRQPLSNRETETLSVMTVPPEIYEASFPCWRLSERKFREIWSTGYNLEAESEGSPLIGDGDVMQRKQFFFSYRK
jgi:putative methyltransferase (TIGR04325 family)